MDLWEKQEKEGGSQLVQIIKYQANNPAGRRAAMQIPQTTTLSTLTWGMMNLSSFSVGPWRNDSQQREDAARVFEHVKKKNYYHDDVKPLL